jgi:hypothetical protein
MRVISVFGFFFNSRNVHSVLTNLPPERAKIAHMTQGRPRFFTLLFNSVLTEKAPDNDKIVHNTRGLGRPFPSGIFVNTSGGRAVWVIHRGDSWRVSWPRQRRSTRTRPWGGAWGVFPASKMHFRHARRCAWRSSIVHRGVFWPYMSS